MMNKVDFTAVPVTCSARPITFDSKLCTGCNRCADVCQVDVMLPSEEAGEHPDVMYPGECYYCGSCVMACSTGAISLHHPLMNQTRFVDTVKI